MGTDIGERVRREPDVEVAVNDLSVSRMRGIRRTYVELEYALRAQQWLDRSGSVLEPVGLVISQFAKDDKEVAFIRYKALENPLALLVKGGASAPSSMYRPVSRD